MRSSVRKVREFSRTRCVSFRQRKDPARGTIRERARQTSKPNIQCNKTQKTVITACEYLISVLNRSLCLFCVIIKAAGSDLIQKPTRRVSVCYTNLFTKFIHNLKCYLLFCIPRYLLFTFILLRFNDQSRTCMALVSCMCSKEHRGVRNIWSADQINI